MRTGEKVKWMYSNPVDLILITASKKVAPYFKQINATANYITTIGNIIRGLSLYYLYQKSYRISALFYLIGYFFDCLDGYYARKYNMISRFGDLYDHISDVVLNIVLFGMIMQINFQYKSLIIGLLMVALLLSLIHFGNEELLYNKESVLTVLETVGSLKHVKYTKFFGCGTFILFTTLFIYNLGYFEI